MMLKSNRTWAVSVISLGLAGSGASAALNTPSTPIGIDVNGGTTTTIPAGVPGEGSARATAVPDGYQVTGEFQLTAIYQDLDDANGIDSGDIETIDDFNRFPIGSASGSGFTAIGRTLNFADAEQYVLQINRDGLTTYQDNVETFDTSVDWALSYLETSGGYSHTILAGTIDGTGANSILQITGGYRSFGGEQINPTEVFDNNLVQIDITGYALALDANDSPVGATLTPVPEPATLSLLALGGAALLRRRRR